MSLSANPFSKIYNTVSDMIKQGAQAVSNQGKTPADIADLNKTVNNYSGAPGTGLNGAAPNGNNVEAGRGQSLISGIRAAANAIGEKAGIISTNAGDTAAAAQRLGIGGQIVGAIGAIGRTAGVINNFASLARGKSLPAGAELFTGTPTTAIQNESGEGDWRVKLYCDFDTLFGIGAFSRLKISGGLIFPFTPNMTITSKANYSTVDPVHSIAPMLAYKNSQVDDITISGDFVVEDDSDGNYYLEAITFLRAATKMFYGSGDFVGNPPIICTLSGYGPQVINNVSVVVKSFNLELKDDVNYIKVPYNGKDNWVPIFSTLTVVVSPIYSRERLRKFSLQNFVSGSEVGIM